MRAALFSIASFMRSLGAAGIGASVPAFFVNVWIAGLMLGACAAVYLGGALLQAASAPDGWGDA